MPIFDRYLTLYSKTMVRDCVVIYPFPIGI